MTSSTGLAGRFLGAAAIVLALDQASKMLVRAALAICPDDPTVECVRVGLLGPFGILNSQNPGTAFGLSDSGGVLPLLLLALVLLAAQAGMTRPSPRLALGLGLQVGGLAGNLVDRLAYGAVTDFLHIAVDGDLFGPVLNLADVGLVIGGVLTAIALSPRPERSALAPGT